MRAARYLRFAHRLFYKRRALPLYLVFFVTHHCTARCRHCLLGERDPRRDELSLDEIERFSRSLGKLLFLLLTGGDPFLREDLAEIAQVFYRNNRIVNLGIPTNGFLTDRVLRTAETILETCPEMEFAVDVSLDGIGEEHDRLRQLPGLFERATATYLGLKELERRYPRFSVAVAITVSAYNQDRVAETYRWLRGKLGVSNVNQLLCRGSPRDPEALKVDLEKYIDFSRQLEEDTLDSRLAGYRDYPFSDLINAMKILRRQVIVGHARGRRRLVPCYAGRLGGVVYSRGEVYPCELLERPLGHLREVDYQFPRIWFSPRADEVRREIERKQCRCTYECFLTNGLLFTPAVLPRLLLEYWRLKVRRFQARRAGWSQREKKVGDR